MAFKKFAKPGFLKTAEFRIFITAWIIYIFYLQMYGDSCMANSQSALTAAIVNEGRIEVDTYYRTSCDVAYYNSHYYSGMAPGVSFLAVPLYAAGKPAFSLLPQGMVDSLYEKLEGYGNKLGTDYWGRKKVLSNYFVGLSKRQILEYVIISGFILPIFTTALIGALSSVLFYVFLKRFTSDEKLRIGITSLYAFGTVQFRSSTLFYQRPISIFLMFAAFFILFRVRNKELRPKGYVLFFSGLLAGISGVFDYFHVFAAGLLLIYLLSFYIRDKSSKAKGAKRFLVFDLNRQRLMLILNFIIGMSIPIILLSWYHYIAFGSPFATSYNYRIVQASSAAISDIAKIKLPGAETMYYMLEFFIYAPIMLLAFYGIYRAFSKRDRYHHDVIAILIFIAFTLVYAAILSLVFPLVVPHFRRYASPIIPYAMLFISYGFFDKSKAKRNMLKKIFIIVGVVSVFINWVRVQGKLDIFDLLADFLQHGPSSSFLDTFAGVFRLNSLIINLAGLIVLTLLIYFIWRPYLARTKKSRQQIAG